MAHREGEDTEDAAQPARVVVASRSLGDSAFRVDTQAIDNPSLSCFQIKLLAWSSDALIAAMESNALSAMYDSALCVHAAVPFGSLPLTEPARSSPKPPARSERLRVAEWFGLVC